MFKGKKGDLMTYLDCVNDFLSKGKPYIYFHYYIKDNGDKHIFYIGKGTYHRVVHKRRNSLHQQYVENLKRQGIEYKREIIEIFDDEKECFNRERELQKYYESIGQAECSYKGYPELPEEELPFRYYNSKGEKFKTLRRCADSVQGSGGGIYTAIRDHRLYRDLYWYKI